MKQWQGHSYTDAEAEALFGPAQKSRAVVDVADVERVFDALFKARVPALMQSFPRPALSDADLPELFATIAKVIAPVLREHIDEARQRLDARIDQIEASLSEQRGDNARLRSSLADVDNLRSDVNHRIDRNAEEFERRYVEADERVAEAQRRLDTRIDGIGASLSEQRGENLRLRSSLAEVDTLRSDVNHRIDRSGEEFERRYVELAERGDRRIQELEQKLTQHSDETEQKLAQRIAELDAEAARLKEVIKTATIDPLKDEILDDLRQEVPHYCGVYSPETEYGRSALVSCSGGMWIAMIDVKGIKPGGEDGHWRLAVKSGKDGRSAYDLARRAGFQGSEREWLNSLKPPAPPPPERSAPSGVAIPRRLEPKQ